MHSTGMHDIHCNTYSEEIENLLEKVTSRAMLQQVDDNSMSGKAAANNMHVGDCIHVLFFYQCFLLYTEPFQPLEWPAGTFSLPKAKSGCPPGFTYGCIFQKKQGGENENVFTSTPAIDQLLDGQFNDNIEMCYCTKLDGISTVPFWPEGRYCIAKKGECPVGFGNGSIFWDDVNFSGNRLNGIIPDGTYTINTEIEYCCRSDNYRVTPIRLPTTHDFVLYPFDDAICQEVEGMTDTLITIRSEDDKQENNNHCSGMRPYDSQCNNVRHNVFLCHYTKDL